MKYQPIDCSFYDRLEHYAVLGRQVNIVYRDPDGVTIEKLATIKDLRNSKDEEFLYTDDLITDPIRLDNLISVDGHLLPKRQNQ